jgi:hypothetical protein
MTAEPHVATKEARTLVPRLHRSRVHGGALVLSLAAAAITLGAGYMTGHGSTFPAAVTFAGAFLLVLIVVPASTLPSITVVVLLLFPIEDLPVSSLAQHLPVALVPLMVWMFRARHAAGGLQSVACAALLLWVLLSFAFAPIDTRAGAIWGLWFIGAPCLIGLTGARATDFRGLQTFVLLSACLGVYAVLETFVLHSNPLMDSLYHDASTPLLQVWSSYRATTVLGHPLVNATVFAVAGVLSFDRYMRGRARRAGIQTVCICLGELATKSRGPAIALGVGLLAVLIFRFWDVAWIRRFVAGAAVLAVAAAAVAILIARSDSAEGIRSANDRASVLANTEQAIAGHLLLGVGPGESEAYRVAAQLRGVSVDLYPNKPQQSPTDLEDAYAEMAVSIGIPGLALFCLVLLLTMGRGMMRQETRGFAAAVGTFAVCIFGFNALEGHPKLLVLLGLLMVFIATGSGEDAKKSRLQAARRRFTARDARRRPAVDY